MANRYLMKYKGTYRVLADIDMQTNDYPRDEHGNIDEDTGLYIVCKDGAKISEYGLDSSRRMELQAYIPSLKRATNIVREMKKQGIPYTDYDRSDEEAIFRFKAVDIDKVASILGAKTYGASISPFSSKNLPKSSASMPIDKTVEYDAIKNRVKKGDYLIIKGINQRFLDEILVKKLGKGRKKTYDYKTEMRQLKMSRDMKLYIYTKGLWQEYLEFLEKEIDKFYVDKEQQ